MDNSYLNLDGYGSVKIDRTDSKIPLWDANLNHHNVNASGSIPTVSSNIPAIRSNGPNSVYVGIPLH